MARPVLFVLAGVNGAGKSSIGGHLLRQAGLNWFDPDDFARELLAVTGCEQAQANAAAWQEGVHRLDAAIAEGRTHAFETTLGGRSIPARIKAALPTHDVLIWFCGLSSPEQHIARVSARVAAGGHDIPSDKIRERYLSALSNLLALMPHLKQLQIYDNSTDAAPGASLPDPLLLAQMESGKLTWPTDINALARTPDWAKPLLEAALMMDAQPRRAQ